MMNKETKQKAFLTLEHNCFFKKIEKISNILGSAIQNFYDTKNRSFNIHNNEDWSFLCTDVMLLIESNKENLTACEIKTLEKIIY